MLTISNETGTPTEYLIFSSSSPSGNPIASGTISPNGIARPEIEGNNSLFFIKGLGKIGTIPGKDGQWLQTTLATPETKVRLKMTIENE